MLLKNSASKLKRHAKKETFKQLADNRLAIFTKVELFNNARFGRDVRSGHYLCGHIRGAYRLVGVEG